MPEAFGRTTRRYEARLAWRPAPRDRPPTAAEHQAMLDEMLARAAVLNGWPDGKPPPWPKRRAAAPPLAPPAPQAPGPDAVTVFG